MSDGGEPLNLIRVMPAEGRGGFKPIIHLPSASAMHIAVIGAGVAGLVGATELLDRGHTVTVFEQGRHIGAGACSWFAGGMLAPWCERESAEPAVTEGGVAALAWWPQHFDGTVQRGTLVVASARDAADLHRFERRTTGSARLDASALADLEPELAGRFQQGLFFADEAHLDPRDALQALSDGLLRRGVDVRLNTDGRAASEGFDAVLDCRGLAGRESASGLRGVRGEMVLVRAPDVTLTRPIRFLHPRSPIYVVPRSDQRFMIGATMIESDHRGPITVRSAVELLNAAFALHSGFAEAEILEFGADARPAYVDNLPHVTVSGRTVSINGLFRHGFLLSPDCARVAADRFETIQGFAA